MGMREDVEFKALDGIVLKGFLYPADIKGPGIVMTPGVCCSLSWHLGRDRRMVSQLWEISRSTTDT